MLELAEPGAGFVPIDQTLAYYEHDARPQLLHSAFAPVILGLGEHAPLIGHRVDYPMQ